MLGVTPSAGLRHPSFKEEGAGKRCSEYPNLSEGTDSVGEQLRGDKESPFSGVTKSGRVRRKVSVGKRCSECV